MLNAAVLLFLCPELVKGNFKYLSTFESALRTVLFFL